MTDIMQSPIIIALLALLAVPGVTSALVTLLRRLTDSTGIPAPAVVYVASLLITGLVVLTSGATLPMLSGDPAEVVAAWLAWATANTLAARALYDVLRGLLGKSEPSPA